MRFYRKVIGLLLVVLTLALLNNGADGASFIVKNGEPNAEIVVAEVSPRMTSFAALELQYYLKKISGAKVPIVFEKTDTDNIKIYVGKSKYTDEMGIDDKDLKYGAFRMVSDKNSFVLLGHDFDYHPRTTTAKWDKETEQCTAVKVTKKRKFKNWWNPKRPGHYHPDAGYFDEFMEKRYGKENRKVWNPKNLEWKWGKDYFAGLKNGYTTGFWEDDQGGSLNAVYSFLRSLGAEWYMPGKLGEIIPELKSIALPDVNKTDKPDFPVRYWFWYSSLATPFEHIMWARRLGMGGYYEMFGIIGHAHGLARIHRPKEMQEKHPEYYALWKGKRITDYRGGGHVCFSSKGFFNETLKYARFMFKEYDVPHISLFPQDGFRHCQCEECKKLSSSDLVWGFVDRVARELYKTHPDKIISCTAYTPYINPPANVEKFTPNVAVIVGKSGRIRMDDPISWSSYKAKVEGWKEKVSSSMIMRGENNLYHNWGKKILFPVIHPRNMVKDIKYLKGIGIGQSSEVSQSRGRWAAPGCDHLTLYVEARFLWDADQDLEKVLAEYYDKFYGPAAKEMKTALDYAEAKYGRTTRSKRRKGKLDPQGVSLPVRIKLLELLHKAREVAGDTIYGKRIDVIITELPDLEKSREELKALQEKGNPRDNALVVEAYGLNAEDNGKTYKLLRTAQRRRALELNTTFNVKWTEKSLTFNIRCEEPDMKSIKVGENVWEGDSLVLILESPHHSFYQIEVSTDGRIFDYDRGGRINTKWASMADVKIEKGEDYWKAKVFIPIALLSEGAEADPMNYVVSPRIKPGQEWFFNIARRRPREGSRESLRKTYTLNAGGVGGRNILARDCFAKLIFK